MTASDAERPYTLLLEALRSCFLGAGLIGSQSGKRFIRNGIVFYKAASVLIQMQKI
jgi:hypothetical protein